MYVETGHFLRQTMRDISIAGGKFEVREFATPQAIAGLSEKLVFNCTGLGSRDLFGDQELHPLRGQLAILLPQLFLGGSPLIVRLFPNHREIEEDYYRRTKILPIMHTVAIKRSVYEKHPWVAMSLYKAFVKSQQETYADLYVTAALKTMLPWLTKHVEDARALMGDDYWPYGFAPNREALATFLRYHHEQGLSKRLLEPEELFAPETLESFKI